MPFSNARKTAACLGDWIRRVEEDLAADKDPDNDPLTPADIEQRSPQRKMLAAVGAYRRKLADQTYVEAILTGQESLQPRQQQRFTALLTFVLGQTELWIRSVEKVEEKVRQRGVDVMAVVAQSPQTLLLLQRYETRLERSIERKLHLLQRA
jgi:hypothetical protein